MEKQKISKGAFILVTGITLLASCNKNDSNQTFQVEPDVITMVKTVHDTVKYAPAFYVYANQNIKSAEVSAPDGSPIELSFYNSNVITYAKLPKEADYTETEPQSGEYAFSVKSVNGDVFTGSDILYPTGLEAPEISGISFNSSNSTMHVNWNTDLGANGYFVRLINNNGETVYTGYNVSADSTSYTIRSTDEGWEQPPYSGTKYILQMNAIEYDADDNLTEYYYHVNAIAFSEEEITWELLN